MSDPVRIGLIGATGLIGSTVMRACVGREDLRLTGIARREAKLPSGIRMELFVAEPDKWGEVIEAVRPRAMICALGTTWNKAGQDEAAFRAVDQDLVLATAEAAKEYGVETFVHVSSVGADVASKTFYLRVKGEVERDLAKLRFNRLDILRPGLLRGNRANDRRPAERLGIAAAPILNLLLHGQFRKYRGVRAETVADAALALAMRPVRGRFVHDHDAILRAARSLPQLAADEV
ncbi:NAD(P)H-binding protein [Qipengyuania marisflavi]|uniref:NAD-dependent epimerase/dehydratase family protein n=1 Tax=Qipengyuania marisflavi TaxID=2486356 RepID=A0A5S3P6P0_9SPHN|nr:NAD(P)H-binding protein [Qipengyuania marisflavi]TMM48898.1 NAD-dependent epimerase/dehydratase family protein [Qipengyuania marisflavi]